MDEKEGIRITKENIDFRRLLMETPGAEKLMRCYQCGVCTADCPVAMRVKEFRPRRIARLAALGQRDRLLGGDTVWLCAGCYTCYERCPEQVRVSEIISALRKLALKEGIIHPTYKALMVSIAEMGYIYEINDFQNEMREDEDLPPAPEPDIDEIESIMRKTGFLDLVEGG
ncbi:MAG: 4Fe-4S dicluster domain-containing protein [Candidatus Bathyarchaeota archaeon]|nr:4Fe-4S dicluster domain-containing protein [Candidatus Bathyarchaeota archaeon]MDH5790749.1 4Fe-4S dicluster domain-containing protein [Candidatus Bathyarchaeota archaeon]